VTTEPTTLPATLDLLQRALVEVDNLLAIAVDQAATDRKAATATGPT
jgi:hypothetical protein